MGKIVTSVPRLRMLPPRLTMLDVRSVKLPAKVVDPHYLTPEHRVWRDGVIKRAGFRCEDCGRTGVRLFADHIVERKDGGNPLDPRNGKARCGSCHGRKTAAERAKRIRLKFLE